MKISQVLKRALRVALVALLTLSAMASLPRVVEAKAKVTLRVGSTDKGTTSPLPGDYTYNSGQDVSVTAIPSTGCVFAFWLLDGVNSGTANPITVTMGGSHYLRAFFNSMPVLNIISPSVIIGNGSFSVGACNPPPGIHTYNFGDNVQVTAVPADGYVFDHWFLDDATMKSENPIHITMDKSHSLYAEFAFANPPELKVGGNWGGTTVPGPGVYPYHFGDSVTVTAIPNPGYKFYNWGVGSSYISQNPITVTITETVELVPFFMLSRDDPPPFNTGPAGVEIYSMPGGTTSPGPGEHTVNFGGSVTVTAIPDPGYIFECWHYGGGFPTQNPITVPAYSIETLSPHFKKKPRINLGTGREEGVPDWAESGGTTDPAPGLNTYDYGDTLVLTAIPEAGYIFTNWIDIDGNYWTQNPITVTADGNGIGTMDPHEYMSEWGVQNWPEIGVPNNVISNQDYNSMVYQYLAVFTKTGQVVGSTHNSFWTTIGNTYKHILDWFRKRFEPPHPQPNVPAVRG